MEKFSLEKRILESFVIEIIKEKYQRTKGNIVNVRDFSQNIKEMNPKEDITASIMEKPLHKEAEEVFKEGFAKEIIQRGNDDNPKKIFIGPPSVQTTTQKKRVQIARTPITIQGRRIAAEAKTSFFNPLQKQAPPQKIIPPPAPSQHIRIFALSKIEPILYDPMVRSVECAAPGNPLLVNRNGAIQATQITLDSDEIDMIMKEISEKSKIPLMPGIFKAAIGDFIVTAILSEFVGTKFTIQKR